MVSDKKKSIEEIFLEQEKKFDFRQDELREYRKKVKEVYEKSDIYVRLNKALKSDNVEVRKITPEKIKDRGKDYGETGIQFKIEYDTRLEKFVMRARNRKGQIQVTTEFEKPTVKKKVTKKERDIIEQKALLKSEKKGRKKIEDRGFEDEYEKSYVSEDLEPEKKGDKRKGVITSYNTYFRYSILIYEYKKGRKYQLIYQANLVQSPRSVYISFQRLIATIKEDILRDTGLSLEEWVYVSKIRKNIHIEGGIKFKRFKGKKFKRAGKWKETLDYEMLIDFESL